MMTTRKRRIMEDDEKQDEARRNQIWKDLLSACPQSNEADRVREMMKH